MELKLVVSGIYGVITNELPEHKTKPVFFLAVARALKSFSVPVAFVANQGGVGLRHYLLTLREEDRFFNPWELPTEEQAVAEVESIIQNAMGCSYPFLLSYSYSRQKPNGQWAADYPPPADCVDLPEWSREWRMPNAGMLFELMNSFDALPEETLVIVDSNGKSSLLKAAISAGCKWQYALKLVEDFLA